MMNNRYRRTSLAQYLVVILGIVGLIGVGFGASLLLRRAPVQDQFVVPWAATRDWLMEGNDPYRGGDQRGVQRTVDKSGYLSEIPNGGTLYHPVINLFLFIPFSLIPYEISRLLWITLSLAAMIYALHLAINLSGWQLSPTRRAAVLALIILFLPVTQTILSGHYAPWIILLLFGGITAIVRKQDTLAGFLLSLTWGALPISLFILIALVAWAISSKRWSILIAFAFGTAFLIVVSILLLPGWPISWLGVMLQFFTSLSWIRTPLMALSAVLPGVATFLSISMHVLIVIYFITLIITLLRQTGRPFIWKVLTILVVAFLIHPLSSAAFIPIVFPAMFMVFRFWHERWRFTGQILTGIVLVGLVVIPWTVTPLVKLFNSLTESVWLISVLPLFILLGMISIRWWAFRVLSMTLDQS